jgi:hypothetical protein
MVGSSCFLIVGNPYTNTIRIIQCVINRIVSGDAIEGDRFELKAIEFSKQAGAHINRYYYAPKKALTAVGRISTVRLNQESDYNDPALIHSPILISMVLSDSNSKIQEKRIALIKDFLFSVYSKEPSLVYELTPEAFSTENEI